MEPISILLWIIIKFFFLWYPTCCCDNFFNLITNPCDLQFQCFLSVSSSLPENFHLYSVPRGYNVVIGNVRISGTCFIVVRLLIKRMCPFLSSQTTELTQSFCLHMHLKLITFICCTQHIRVEPFLLRAMKG